MRAVLVVTATHRASAGAMLSGPTLSPTPTPTTAPTISPTVPAPTLGRWTSYTGTVGVAETFSCTTDGCVIAVTYAKPTSSPFLFLTVDKMRGDLDQYWEYADLKVNGQSTNVICGSSASQCWDEHLCVSDLDISNYVSPGDTSITVTLDATQWVNALCPLKARLSLQTSTHTQVPCRPHRPRQSPQPRSPRSFMRLGLGGIGCVSV